MVAEGMMLRTRFSPSAYYSLKIVRFVVRSHASTSILHDLSDPIECARGWQLDVQMKITYLSAQETGGRVDVGVHGRHLDEAVDIVLLGKLGENTGSLNMNISEREVPIS